MSSGAWYARARLMKGYHTSTRRLWGVVSALPRSLPPAAGTSPLGHSQDVVAAASSAHPSAWWDTGQAGQQHPSAQPPRVLVELVVAEPTSADGAYDFGLGADAAADEDPDLDQEPFFGLM